MNEYEYSKKVKSLKKYINYCEENDFVLKERTKQIRTIYRKNDSTMARITINEKNGILKRELDFKEDKLSNEELIIRRESLALEFNDEKAIESILDFLGYKQDNTLERTRYVYEKEDAKFEFDEYVKPEKCNVVSLEGDKEKVDKIWKEIDQ